MTVPKHCKNRKYVNAEGRLYSPEYDFEGDDGLAWYELTDMDAMCLLGICSHKSYNAWVKATDHYIYNVLTPHYKKVSSRAEAIYGGAVLPFELADKLNNVGLVITEWKNADYRPNKAWKDDFSTSLLTWKGEIRKIIKHYDEAACAFDMLNDIAATDLKQPALAKGVPTQQYQPIEGGYLGGAGTLPGSGDQKKSSIGRAVGILALGAAGYFGYKVLTE